MRHQKATAILLLSCPDQKGIVAEIASFIYQYSGNIVHSDQHTDYETLTFFMRIEWELDGFLIPRGKISEAFGFIASKFGMDFRLLFSDTPLKLGIMVSRFDHCLYDLLLKIRSGDLFADAAVIVSNHGELRPIAQYFGIPFEEIPVKPDNKEEAEALQLAALSRAGVDTVILARYMQVLSGRFIADYPGRIINIHHSFLPAFIGARPYHQAHARGVKIIGATSHFVTEELDNGPIIEQDVMRVSHRDSIDDLVQKGRELEKLVLSRAVKLYLEHKVLVSGNKTVIFD